MKASFYKIIFDKETPFRCTYIDLPNFNHPWHFHPEFELTLILESDGIRYIGDNTSRFIAGDLVLVGSNMPHMWVNDKTEALENNNKEKRSKRITLQFPPDLIDNMFKNAQELQPLVHLFKQAQRGISFSQKTSDQIKPLLFDINNKKGLRKWISVFNLLFELTEADDYSFLASQGYLPQLTNKDYNLINTIFNHIENNFNDKIILKEMADLACLTKPSFCRLFKQKTGKAFFVFLNEYRINYAKRLLLDSKNDSINTIAIHSGFPTIQHFNKKFKEFNKGLTPTQFLKNSAKMKV